LEALSPGVKRQEGEAENSPISSAEVSSAWRYTSTPPYVLMEWCLIKRRESLPQRLRINHTTEMSGKV
jgi:hypothetical protein